MAEEGKPAIELLGVNVRKTIQTYKWYAIVLMIGVLFCLGWSGYAKIFPDRSLSDTLFASVRLFFLEGVRSGGVWQLEIARWLAPVVLAASAVFGFIGLFHERCQMLWLRVGREPVVICGLGRKGLQLVKDFTANGDRVVVVEIDKKNSELPTCRDLGVTVVIGDATQKETLRKIRVNRAKTVITACGDDDSNIDIALTVQRLFRQEGHKRKDPLKCCVHVVDPNLCRLFRQHEIFLEEGGFLDISVYNVFENGARHLFDEQPLDYEEVAFGGCRKVHLIVAGFNSMGESVVLQAAKLGHFANGKRLHITVFDDDQKIKEKSFLSRYPYFNKFCEIHFEAGGIEDPEVVERIVGWSDDVNFLMTVVVCNKNGSLGLSSALNLLQYLQEKKIPIRVHLPGNGGLEHLIRGDRPLGFNVSAFGMIEKTCASGMVVLEDHDRQARNIHDAYVKSRLDEGEIPESRPALLPWEKLNFDFRDSNRQQADHIPVKLRALSMGIQEKDKLQALDNCQIEILSEMEHSRWCAERWLAGWSYGPREDSRKRHPNLVSWSDLPEQAKALDREAIMAMPKLLASQSAQ